MRDVEILLFPDEKGSLWEYKKETEKGSRKFKTIFEAKVNPEGYLTYRIYDISNLEQIPITDILFKTIISQPEFKNYLKKLASGQQDINEQLRVLTVKTSEKLYKYKVMALKNVVTVIENDKIVLNFEFPLKMAVCQECGKPFIHGKHGKPQKFCSTTCKMRVYRRNKRNKQSIEVIT